MAKSHKQVEFVVDDASGHQRSFKTFNEAAGFAIGMGAMHGDTVNIDVLIYGESGARWWGGDDAVRQYREDPEASISDRIEIKVNHVGRIA